MLSTMVCTVCSNDEETFVQFEREPDLSTDIERCNGFLGEWILLHHTIKT